MALASNALTTLASAKLIAGVADLSAFATGFISAYGQPTPGKGDTIGDKKYVYVAALTGADLEVLIGTTAAITLDRLKLAVLRTDPDTYNYGGTAPVYSVAAANLKAEATENTDISQHFQARTGGTAGNAVALVCESGTNHLATGPYLTGGGEDTVNDPLFERLINAASSQAERRLSRKFGLATLDEFYAPPGRQLIILRQWPLRTVISVAVDGNELEEDVDYSFSEKEADCGFLYREQGWSGSSLIGYMTGDPVGASRSIEIKYTAGYLLPGDAGYSEGGATALPLEISDAIDQLVAIRYFSRARQGYGIGNLKEGGASYQFNAEIPDSIAKVLDRYKRIAA